MLDANQNGRDELFWALSGPILPNESSWIFEKPVTSSSGTFEPDRTARLQIHPNPVRGLAQVIVAPELPAFEVLVYDVTGRKIRSFRADRSAGTLLINASGMPAGSYFARVVDASGGVLNHGRFMVLR